MSNVQTGRQAVRRKFFDTNCSNWTNSDGSTGRFSGLDRPGNAAAAGSNRRIDARKRDKFGSNLAEAADKGDAGAAALHRTADAAATLPGGRNGGLIF